MMELDMRVLSRQQMRRIYRWEMQEAFPRVELKPLWTILRLMERGEYDALGFYRGEELVGYALLRLGERFVLLDYLAACQGKRGGGVGSAMLAELQRRYAATGGLLAEVEALEEDLSPEEGEKRRRRLAFYTRNGFFDLNYQADIFRVRYAMLGWSASGSMDTGEAMEAHRALYRLGTLLPLYRRYVHIPIQEKEGTKP